MTEKASPFTGQVALVTGGVRGIGLAICERLIDQGARVAAGYSRNSELAEKFLATHGASGATLHQGNIANATDCERVVEEVIEQHGGSTSSSTTRASTLTRRCGKWRRTNGVMSSR